MGKKLGLTTLVGYVLIAAGIAAAAYGAYLFLDHQQSVAGKIGNAIGKLASKTPKALVTAYTYMACGAVEALAGAYLGFARRGRG